MRTLINQPYVLAICAGVILSLGFPVAGLWPLILPGLALYFFNAAHPSRTHQKVWWSGFITGAIVDLWLSYQALGHISIESGAEPLFRLAHLASVPIALVFGIVFGVVALLFHSIRTRSALLNSLAGASLFIVGEALQQWVMQGYYWGSLAHPFAAFAPALSISSLGGIYVVSFCIAWVACLAAECVPWRPATYVAVATTAVTLILLWTTSVVLIPRAVPTGSLTVASVQVARSDSRFERGSPFIVGTAKTLLAAAGHSGADLVIYPQTITPGALYEGTPSVSQVRGMPITTALGNVGPWLNSLVASSSTALIWSTVYNTNQNVFYEAFQFFKGGLPLAEYRKHYLYPFTDYFPTWMRTLGLVTRNDSITPGPLTAYTQVGAWRVGAIDCSELNRHELARAEARESDFLLSMGSDTVHNNSMPPQYTLEAARYTAAENHIPLLRVALTGPSAIINPDGSLGPMLDQEQPGILLGTITLYKNQQTVYNRFGSVPVAVLVVGIIATALYTRRRSR